MECLICGKEFESLSARGIKPKYCSIECKKLAMRKAQKKYVEKMKMKNALKEQPQIVQMSEKTSNVILFNEIISKKSDVEIEDNSKVIELSRKAGALRFEFVEELTKLKAKLS